MSHLNSSCSYNLQCLNQKIPHWKTINVYTDPIILGKQEYLMKQYMQTLINLLTNNDDKALLQHYLASNESENIVQLGYLFKQGRNDVSKFEFYQQIATQLIGSKSLPIGLIGQIKTSASLSFFTPVLQLKDNFNKADHLQRNALHYLLAGNLLAATNTQPPFNYLRSMMLFERNEILHDALCRRDHQNFTPIEVYLFTNQNLTTLPPHEFSALLALIEIESKRQTVDDTNYLPIALAIGKLCHSQVQLISSELQRIILIAIYFKKSIKDVVNEIN